MHASRCKSRPTSPPFLLPHFQHFSIPFPCAHHSLYSAQRARAYRPPPGPPSLMSSLLLPPLPPFTPPFIHSPPAPLIALPAALHWFDRSHLAPDALRRHAGGWLQCTIDRAASRGGTTRPSSLARCRSPHTHTPLRCAAKQLAHTDSPICSRAGGDAAAGGGDGGGGRRSLPDH